MSNDIFVTRMKENIIQLWNIKSNLLSLIVNDFHQNYLSSYLGFSWSIISPLANLLLVTVVFQVGFRVPPVTDGVPFVAWLACGMILWQFITDGLVTGANSVTSYGFLVRKATFRTAYLPLVRVAAVGIIHLCMVSFLISLLFYFGIWPAWFWLQWLYYEILTFLFLVGISWLTSAISIFVPDIISIINIIVSLCFWATPLVWNVTMVPKEYRWLFSLNPIFYLVQGYRDTFLEERWFWQRPLWENVLFFSILCLVLGIGALVFKKLRPHFADVL